VDVVVVGVFEVVGFGEIGRIEVGRCVEVGFVMLMLCGCRSSFSL
jgi:hypothetical protein